ncbi:MAG TPA: hypothetical protein VNU46_06625 [Gemmatimonadaceae bacterium]|jgi:hypothetical protein|nr:hypothetical protein [Gemmatimonadaceae bacterium]
MTNRVVVSATRRWSVSRLVALLLAALALICLLVSSARVWMFTTGASTSWRLRMLLPDALWLIPCILGAATAARSSVPWRRRLGWSVFGVALVAELLWTFAALPLR